MKLGVRWDEPCQDQRIERAFDEGLIDFIEANYPIIPGVAPHVPDGLEVLVHCPVNGVASAHGPNMQLARAVKDAADEYGSPWIGEHLCWAGPDPEGRLGYIVTPVLCPEFVAVAARNARLLKDFYDRPLALELGPSYQNCGSCDSEMHFLAEVAEAAGCDVILDVAHWSASNRNLNRAPLFGIDQIDPERIIELHIAGLRPNGNRSFWHDSHDRVPDRQLMALTMRMCATLPNLKALTFEHAPAAPEDEFLGVLRELRRMTR